jgi:pentose-5-phosphate-3-epimerase
VALFDPGQAPCSLANRANQGRHMITYHIAPHGNLFQVIETIKGEPAKAIVALRTEAEARAWLHDHLRLLSTTDLAPWIQELSL